MDTTTLTSRAVYLRKNSVKIAKVTDASLSSVNGTVDITALGDGSRSYLYGLQDVSISGTLLMKQGNTEQEAMRDAHMAKTGLSDIDFYFDSTTVLTNDVITDTDACWIVTEWNPGASVGDNAVPISFTLQASGPVYYTSD